jgi:hypothetical protein
VKKTILVALAIMICSSAFCGDIDSKRKLTEQGDAVAQDYAEAYFWQNLAANQKAEYAKGGDETAAKLTPDQIEKRELDAKMVR